MPRIAVKDMTDGQLKLEFASLCRYHQADGVRALGFASVVPVEFLRECLAKYHSARSDKAREEALLRVVHWKKSETVD